MSRVRGRMGPDDGRVKRYHIVKDQLRFWKEGVRYQVMEICCALHNFRACLTPWRSIMGSGYAQTSSDLPNLSRCQHA